MLPILPIHGSSNKSTKKKRPRVLPQSSNKKKKASAPPVSGSASCSAAKPNVPSAASKSTTPAAVTGAAAAGITAESTSTKPSTDVKQPSSINNPTKAIANTAATTSPTSEIKSKEASAAIAALFKDEISSAAIPASKDAAAVAAIEAETTPPPSGKRNANASIGIHVLGSAGATKSATKPKAKPSFRPIAKATKHKPKAKANAKKIASKVPNPGSSTDAATTSANAMAASAASIKAGNHDEALVLAAEAAAALLEGEEGVDGMMVPMGLLEDVAPALEDGEQHIADDEVDMGDEHDLESPGNIHREEVDENKKSLRAGGALYHATNGEGDLEKHGENENVPAGDTQLESHNNGPLGPMSQVRSFETKFPQTAEVTPAHSNFLSYYYSNQAAEAHALEARRASRKKKSNSDGSDSDESDDSDDERSVVEEDSDEEEEDKVNEGTKSDDDDREKDETADGDNADQDGESVEGKVDGEGKIEKVETVVTMRDFCSKYPKPDAKPGGRKKKQSDEDAGHNSDSEPREGEEATTNETNENNVNSSNSDEIQKEGDVEAKNAEDETGRNGDEDGVAVEADADRDETNNDGLQVEVIDGQIVVAESSLLANPENRKTTEQIDKEFGSVVEDDSSSQIGAIQAKYDSFLNVPRASNVRWSAEETKRFYHAMRQCGTDFSMMEMIMPGRKRAQLKKKFKVESRKNPRLVDLALDPRCKIKLDLSQFGQDLEIPDEVPPIRVTPSDSPSPGPSNSKKEEQSTAEFGRRPGSGLSNDYQNPFNGNNGGRGGQKSERAFDHLFNEENEEIVEEVVEDEESENLTTNENSRTKSVLSEVEDKPVSLSKSVTSVSKEKPKSNTASSATKSKPKEEGLSIVPLTPGMQKNPAKKKTRFKVKPKPSKKTGKK